MKKLYLGLFLIMLNFSVANAGLVLESSYGAFLSKKINRAGERGADYLRLPTTITKMDWTRKCLFTGVG